MGARVPASRPGEAIERIAFCCIRNAGYEINIAKCAENWRDGSGAKRAELGAMAWCGIRELFPFALVWALVAACDESKPPGSEYGGEGGDAGRSSSAGTGAHSSSGRATGGTSASSGGAETTGGAPSQGGAGDGGTDSDAGTGTGEGGRESHGGAGADGGREFTGGAGSDGGRESYGGEGGVAEPIAGSAGAGMSGGSGLGGGGTLHCDFNPCFHAGFCRQSSATEVACSCMAGHYGMRCERSFRSCNDEPALDCDPLRPCVSRDGVASCSDCPAPYSNLGTNRCQLPSCVPSDCYTGPAGTADVGVCRRGRVACDTPEALCFGERLPSGETCNAEDDDCNGLVDDLPAVTCGLGVCTRAVPACGADGPSVCVPGNPSATTDACNGLDDDCDGVVDEDCAPCLQVSSQGDDAAAAASDAATPFASVQAAIDFAALRRAPGARICVAAGPACGATGSFAGPTDSDLQVRNGIHLLANYESTGWTRCDNSTTRLVPTTGRGVTFEADVVSTTLLDGFTIDRLAGELSVGVSIIGARGVVLSNLSVPEGLAAMISYGVSLENGAEARIVRSRIEAGRGSVEAIGVRAVSSLLAIEDSCEGNLDARGHCTTTRSGRELPSQCTDQDAPSIRGPRFDETLMPARGHAVVLYDSPGSIIDRSTLCSELHGAVDSEFSVIKLEGASEGTLIRASSLAGFRRGRGKTARGVDMTACGGAPRLEGSDLTLLISSGNGDGLSSGGDCAPVIDSSSIVVAGGPSTLRGMTCEAVGGAASECVLSNSRILVSPDAEGCCSERMYGTGLDCRGGSCARIVNNYIIGSTDEVNWPNASTSSMHSYAGIGLTIDGGTAFVAGNEIRSGCGDDMLGMRVVGASSRIENNLIFGASGMACNSIQPIRVLNSIGLAVRGGAVDLHSNLIAGIPYCNVREPDWSSRTVPSDTALVLSTGSVARNNLILTGACRYSAGVDAALMPTAFQHNDITPGGVLYETAHGMLNRIDGVNQLEPSRFFGNISTPAGVATDGWHLTADSACVDAGTSEGAPLRDRDGNLRDDGHPDIGPDEVE
jgi:hypothetical protein